MKKALFFIWETTSLILIALAIVIPLRLFVFQPFLVRGNSMEPNFHNGDYLIVDEISYRFKNPSRGDVIVFKFPYDTTQRYIKRIIGLPGETVEVKGGKIVIYKDGAFVLEESYIPSAIQTQGTTKVELKDNEYFVLGDNRQFSSDSRRWGPLPEENIIGKALFRVLPLSTMATIAAPNY